MNNNILIKIEKEVFSQANRVKISEYITSEYVYTKTEKGEMIYINKNKNLYDICFKDKTLKEIDIDTQKKQFEKIKPLLPELDFTYSELENDIRKCEVNGRNINSVLNAEVIINKEPCFSKTCYLDYHTFSQKTSFLPIQIEDSEFISNMNFSLNIQGNLNKTTIKNQTTEILTDSEIKNEYDIIAGYKII
ncbi:hypothetical protein ABW636_21285 [Aquimarina sp. 2201CG1-2-11]|uniref:hypothetical protein n=1 Tax=Aquimarina discodermiae TaxID=3231043 RepID=UPI00346372AE